MNIYDIAKQCGVSIATVSRVLNNSDKVSENTRQKVISAINKNNYVPSHSTKNTSQDIAVVCSYLESDNTAHTVQVISNRLSMAGFTIHLYCCGNEAVDKSHILEKISKQTYFSVIICGTSFFEYTADITAYMRPFNFSCPVIMLGVTTELDNYYCCEYDISHTTRSIFEAALKTSYKSPLFVYKELNRHSKTLIDIFTEICSKYNIDTGKGRIKRLSGTEDISKIIKDAESSGLLYDYIISADTALNQTYVMPLKSAFSAFTVSYSINHANQLSTDETLLCDGNEYSDFAVITVNALKKYLNTPTKVTYPIIKITK